MYAKDPLEAKYQFLINKREGVDIDHFNDPKAFTEYSNESWFNSVYSRDNLPKIKDGAYWWVLRYWNSLGCFICAKK